MLGYIKLNLVILLKLYLFKLSYSMLNLAKVSYLGLNWLNSIIVGYIWLY
jgi:hypothetical protein